MGKAVFQLVPELDIRAGIALAQKIDQQKRGQQACSGNQQINVLVLAQGILQGFGRCNIIIRLFICIGNILNSRNVSSGQEKRSDIVPIGEGRHPRR